MKSQGGVELVSPVLKPTSTSLFRKPGWVRQVRQVWRVILENFTVVFSKRASTHIHVKRLNPSLTQYTLVDIKGISKEIVYWQSVDWPWEVLLQEVVVL